MRALLVLALALVGCNGMPEQCETVPVAQTCVATVSGICTPGITNGCMEAPGIVVDGWCVPDKHPECRSGK